MGDSTTRFLILALVSHSPCVFKFSTIMIILLQSPHPSTSPVILGYQDIYIYFHIDRFPLLKALTGSHFSQAQLFIEMPCQPTYQPFPPWRGSVALFARWSMSLPEHRFLCLPFNNTNTRFTLYKLISPSFLCLYFS